MSPKPLIEMNEYLRSSGSPSTRSCHQMLSDDDNQEAGRRAVLADHNSGLGNRRAHHGGQGQDTESLGLHIEELACCSDSPMPDCLHDDVVDAQRVPIPCPFVGVGFGLHILQKPLAKALEHYLDPWVAWVARVA